MASSEQRDIFGVIERGENWALNPIYSVSSANDLQLRKANYDKNREQMRASWGLRVDVVYLSEFKYGATKMF